MVGRTDEMTISSVCVECGFIREVRVKTSDYEDYENGKPIQHAFPYLSDGDRELILSGVCDTCFDKMFPEEPDEEEREKIEDQNKTMEKQYDLEHPNLR